MFYLYVLFMKMKNYFIYDFKISLQGVMCCEGLYWNKEKLICESNIFFNMLFRVCLMYCVVF